MSLAGDLFNLDGSDQQFQELLKSCGCKFENIKIKNQVVYLSRYFADIGTKTAVIERNYVDKDFLEDHAKYYSRCFHDYPRTCSRIHFFSISMSQEMLEAYILDGISPEGQDIDLSYQGFVVVRPLPRTIIGRTCLVPYCADDNRFYLARRRVSVSFFGHRLQVITMPYQEQDFAVAACATCSLWSALAVTSELFSHPTYSPIAITEMSTDHGLSAMRSMPNHGLSLNDVVYAIRKTGLVPECLDACHLDKHYRRSRVLGTIYSYLKLGIPIILLGKRIVAGSCDALHAVVINGYHLSSAQEGAQQDMPSLKSLYAEKIDKLYIHDDQLGPFARANVCDSNLLNFDLPIDGQYSIEPHYLIVPIYHKIRVAYSEVWGQAYELHKFLKGLTSITGLLELIWDISLISVSQWKEIVRNDERIPRDEKLQLLVKSLPKYLWRVRVACAEKDLIDFVIDATDSGQGLQVVALVCYSQDIPDLIKAFFDVVPELPLNPLASACVEGV